MRRILLMGSLLSISISLFSQQEGPTPGQLLRLARSTYEQGRLHEVEGQLDPVLKDSRASKTEIVEAYKLRCLAYIYLEEPEKADQAMLNILRTDPYFEINAAVDPAEFVALYKTFRTTPIYRLGAKIGVNASRPNVVESLPAVDLSDGSKYSWKAAFQFGATFDLPLNFLQHKTTLHADLLLQAKRFELIKVVDRGTTQSGENLINELQGTESQNWISLPVTLEYEFLNKRYHPYIALGMSFDYILKSEIVSERPRENETAIQEQTYVMKREKFGIGAVGAVGIKLRMAGGYFVAESRFIYGLNKTNSKETAYDNLQFTLEQGYADPVFKMTSLVLTVGYVQNIFKPKKLIKRK